MTGSQTEFTERENLSLYTQLQGTATRFSSPYSNQLAFLWCAVCLHRSGHRHTRLRTPALLRSGNGHFSAHQGVWTAVINRGPRVPASPPKQPPPNELQLQWSTGRTNWRLAWPFNPAKHGRHLLWAHTHTHTERERERESNVSVHPKLPLRASNWEASLFWPLKGLCVYLLTFFPSGDVQLTHLGAALLDFKGAYPPHNHALVCILCVCTSVCVCVLS